MSSRRERLLPYAYGRSELELAVTACVLDGKDRVPPDSEKHVVELDVDWTTATLTLDVAVPIGMLARVLPEGAGPDEADVLVRLQCSSTFVRAVQRVPMTVAHDGRVSLEWTLRRSELADAAYVQAFMVRNRPATSGRGVARTSGARLADSSPWELRIDRGPTTRGEYLDVRYRPFLEDATLPKRDRKNLYTLDLDQESPTLWLNADHERIAGILDSKGSVGRHARLRDVMFDQIAHAVWSQLFVHAARRYIETGDSIYPWQDPVLDLVLRDLYPNLKNATERRDALAMDWVELPDLLKRLDAALQRKNDLVDHLAKLISEQERQ